MKAENRKPDTYYIEGIVQGDIAVLGQAITLAESQQDTHRRQAAQVLQALMPRTGQSFRLGITGVPGVGKSTFIENFGQLVVSRGHRLAVLAIDPSSARSKGSILGDKTRMEKLSAMPHVYIRPSPSGGELGGITRSTYESILLCEAAGFDYIIIETVGVGQNEVAVNSLCDFFLLLMLAGAGDELQGIKRGIMEMADALVITKADGNNVEPANAARAEYAHAMHLLQAPESGWTPRTMICSGLNGLGMEEIYDMLQNYRVFTTGNTYFFNKRKQQQFQHLLNYAGELLKSDFYTQPFIAQKLVQLKMSDNFEPYFEARNLVMKYFSESGQRQNKT